MNHRIRILCAFLLSATAGWCQFDWQLRNPQPFSEAPEALASDGTQVVVAGSYGLIIATADGQNWERRHSGTGETFKYLHHLGHQWFAVGETGAIFVSADGLTWEQTTNGLGAGRIVVGQGRLVAATQDPLTVSRWSIDGRHWHAVELPAPYAGVPTDVAYAQERFWLATAEGDLFSSDDGQDWTAAAAPPDGRRIIKLIAAPDRLLALVQTGNANNSVFVREASGDWQSLGLSGADDFDRIDGQFFYRSALTTYVSDDATTWSETDQLPATAQLRSLTQVGDLRLVFNGYRKLQRSIAAAAWEDVVQSTFLNTQGIAYTDGRWLTWRGSSADGTHWDQDTIILPARTREISSANGSTFIITNAYSSDVFPLEVWRKTEGEAAFTRVATFPRGSSWHSYFHHANGTYLTFVKVDNTLHALHSTNGTDWELDPLAADAADDLYLIGADADFFYATNLYGEGDLMRSPNGIDWELELAPQPGNPPIRLAASPAGNLLTSSHGYYVKPTGGSWRFVRGIHLRDVHFTGSRFVATSNAFGNVQSIHTLVTDDTWSTRFVYGEVAGGQIAGDATRTGVAYWNSFLVAPHDSDLTLDRGLPLRTDAVLEQPVTLSVAARSLSGQPLTYQWSHNGVDIAGATSAQLTFTPAAVSTDSDSVYSVRIDNGSQSTACATALHVYASDIPLFDDPENPIRVTYVPTGDGNYRVVFSTQASGPGSVRFRWVRNDVAITGATDTHYEVLLTPADDGTRIGVRAINENGYSEETVTLTGPKPEIRAVNLAEWNYDPDQPDDSAFQLDAYVSNSTRLQWRRNGVPLPGATHRSLRLAISAENAGTYDLVASSDWGTAVSAGRFIPGTNARLENLSVRAWLPGASSDEPVIPGVVIARDQGGDQPLVRAIGPTLRDYGVADALTDPALTIVDQDGSTIAQNDQWHDHVQELAPLFGQLGAFALPTNSYDAAALASGVKSIGQRSLFTVPVRSQLPENGEVLVELYRNPGATAERRLGDRLINLSCRSLVDPAHPLTAGFVVGGDGELRLLLRGIGPPLGDYDVATPLPNPKIVLFDVTGREIGNNDTWGDSARFEEISAAIPQVGAFPLATDSNDAAMLVTLPPGVYTLQVQTVGTASGVAMVELYEVP